jgi:uncharacterized protein (DUF58 family)
MHVVSSLLQRFRAQTTGRAWAMMALLAVVVFLGLATGAVVLYRVSYFLVLVLAGSYVWARHNLWRLHMWVGEQSSAAQVGDTLSGSVYVRNDSFLPVSWVEIVQASDMPGHACGGATRLPSHGWEAWSTERHCHARGMYTIGPLLARTSDPLGLFRVEKAEGDPVEVTVYPPVVELPYLRLPVAGLSGEQRVLRRPHAHSAQASTVREYRQNDSLRLIHWPSTAKWDRLMCKEFDSGGHGDVWIVVDLERQVHASVGTEKTDEYAVAAAASAAHRALADERSIGLIACGDQEYVLPLGHGSRQMSEVLETLAMSKTEGEVALSSVLRHNGIRLVRPASLLVVTSSVDPEWVDALEELSHSGVSVMAFLVDPASFGREASCHRVITRLGDAGISVYIIRRGESLPLALAAATDPRDPRVFEQRSLGELIPTSKA